MAKSGQKKLLNMLRKRSDFIAARSGVRANASALRIEAFPTAETSREPRIGITVTKKNGNAVVRTRIKRRIRHALYAHTMGDMRAGHDYVFISKPNALSIPFEILCADIAGLIEKSHKRLDSTPAAK